MDLAQCRALLTAALAVTQIGWLEPAPSVVTTVKHGLDGWRGVGRIATGMLRQGYDLYLRGDQEGLRARFLLREPQRPLPAQILREPTTPWDAVQRAAWYALQYAEPGQYLTRMDASQL